MEKDFSTSQFKKLQQIISERTGLCCPSDRLAYYMGFVLERMSALDVDVWEYFDRIEHTPKEFEKLINLMTVGETYFFRNERQFDILHKFVIPFYAERAFLNPGRKENVNIWSAGVSTGEEAYSIAILFKQAMKNYPSWEISVLGTDINTESLETARKGVYQKRSLQYVDETTLETFFVKTGNSYRVCDEIKSMVKLEAFNLMNGPYDSGRFQPDAFDIVFCRNVIIYFESAAVKKIIPWFHQVINPGGYLFLGGTESLWGISNRFHTIEFPHAFIYQKQEGSPTDQKTYQRIPAGEIKTPALNFPEAGHEVSENDSVFAEARIAFERKDYESALEKLKKYRPEKNGDSDALMLKSQILSNQEEYDEALECLNRVLGKNNLNKTAYYLKGVIYSKMNEMDEAIEQYRKALYVDYDQAIVHFQLAGLFRGTDDAYQAARHYREAIQLLDNMEEQSLVELSDGMSAGMLARAARAALSKMEGVNHG